MDWVIRNSDIQSLQPRIPNVGLAQGNSSKERI